MVGQEHSPDPVRRAEAGVDPGLVREPPACLEPDHDDHLDEDRPGCEHRAELLPARPAGPRRIGASPEVGGHEQEHHHHGAGVDEHLARRDELGREQQVEDRERGEIADQRERRVKGVGERDDRDARGEAAEGREDPDCPDDHVRHYEYVL